MKVVFYSVICFLFLSCNSDTSIGGKKMINEIIKDESGLLRGLDLGTSVDEVKKAESVSVSEESPDYLLYEFAVDSLNNYTVSYTFESNALTEIRADIYVANDSSAQKLTDSFIEYFTKRYKDPQRENENIWSWPTFYNNMAIRIDLSDESADYHHVGKLSLVIYKEPEMAM